MLHGNSPVERARDWDQSNRIHFIFGEKCGGHEYLFDQMEESAESERAVVLDVREERDSEIGHPCRIADGLLLNRIHLAARHSSDRGKCGQGRSISTGGRTA